MSARPIFVVSSGRSGTAMMQRLFAALPGVAMQHEYMVHIVQPLAVKRYMGLATVHEAREALRATHGAAIHYAQTSLWGDSSNKLSWLIPELAELFPEARFVHLVRDGRKVAGSYFRKLANECYDDRSTAVLRAWAEAPGRIPAPPPEKKYWWPLPCPGHPDAGAFASFSQFERIAWHWAEINRVVIAALASLPAGRFIRARLEDLAADPRELVRLVDFIGVRAPGGLHALLRRPHNVNRPEDALLDPEQSARFAAIAWPVMETLGYAGRAEYAVNY